MSEKQALHDLYLSLMKEMKEIEELVLRQTDVIFAQTRAILRTKSRLDGLIAAYLKLQAAANVLAVDQNKEYDKKMEEATDIVVGVQKYKM